MLAGDARVHDDVVRRLVAACRTGEVNAIRTVLDPAVVAVCDGGDRVPAPTGPVRGAVRVARLLGDLLPGTEPTIGSVNGCAGLVIRRAGTAVAVIAVGCAGERATTLWVVLNPAKLRPWHRR
ncbi:siderophore-interacting protein [Micromonospora sp. NBC_01796]|uniref:siderophore-interacting protein n=1 Tax=Micromonospora sp. NBC_01796 TaxID=2975987 RepID=UPI002DD9514F|nr:siderophore-interacting protein [Micromonospora sp. NBC_01796]WSA84069.1 siderophore-interacting protein [Micromonospora sp. NBC_01796]